MNAVNAVGLAVTVGGIWALRSDGAVFVLVKHGSLMLDGRVNDGDPFWAACPAVPGTEAAKEQEG